MKNILYILFLLPLLSMGQTTTQNYVKTLTYKDPTANPDETKARVQVTYFDGLGRPVQQVAGKASPTGNDIITHIEYDVYNRQPREYLPYEAGTASLAFDTSAKTNTEEFYLDPQYENTPNPYSEQFFEASPLSRVLKQGAPGAVWQGNVGNNNDHTVKFDYQANKPSEVRRFKVTFPDENNTEKPELTCTGNYLANSLFKTITKNENWTTASGKCNTVEEFKDKQGRLILKRTYVKSGTNDEPLDTYYVYDRFNNLTYVIPPLAADQIVIRSNIVLFGSTNYAWTKTLAVSPTVAASYADDIASYPNSDILNIDSMAAYGARGGFSISASDEGNLTLSLNITTQSPMAYQTGQITSLDEFGSFADAELGRITGSGYEYIFVIRSNALMVTGYGLVPSTIKTFTLGANLHYSKNYPWTDVCIADPKVVSDYNRDIAGLNNKDILTTYTPNPYNASGGFSITLTEDNNLTLSANILSDVAMDLVTGPVITLDIQRALEDITLGTVSGDGYSYEFTVKSNVLHISGWGKIQELQFTLSQVYAFNYTIREEAKRLCYIYHYDGRNRVVEKHIPDNGWNYIIYDKRNRPVFTQDENMRIPFLLNNRPANKWLFTQYDAFDRIAYTGSFTSPGFGNNADRLILQQDTNGRVQGDNRYSEARSSTGFVNGGLTVYYSQSFFNTANIDVFMVNYYDDYDFDTKLDLEGYTNGQPPMGNSYTSFTTNRKGLATGTKVRVLGTSQWITNIMAHDEKARKIWDWQHNPFLGSTYSFESGLDFLGNLLGSKTQHTKTSQLAIVAYDYYTYDIMGRLLTHSQKIGNGPQELLAWNKYDDLGQLKEKKVGAIAGTGLSYADSGLQKIDYTYNIRGWLKSINNPEIMENDLFAFDLKYNDYFSLSKFNGNIAQTRWKTINDNILKNYDYAYDAMDRLIDSGYYENSGWVPYNESNIEYDKNGNIMRLLRAGSVTGGYDLIDNLSYIYKPYSNQLLKVTDTSYNDAGFTDGINKIGDDYSYDAAGNMKKDTNKGIGDQPAFEITYNHLNLPVKIGYTPTKYIEYIYTAAGEKLRKQVRQSDVISVTDYANGFVYQNGEFHYFPTPEGYARRETNGNFVYIYQFKDHVGSVRLSYWRNGNNLEIIEAADYYPFGMQLARPGNIVTSTNLGQMIKFQEQERQDELDLNWDSFKWRNYDYAIGRFMSVDPLAEKYAYNSVYAFQENKLGMGRELEGLELTAQGTHLQAKLNQVVAQTKQTVNNAWNATGDFLSGLITPSQPQKRLRSDKDVSTTFVSKNGGNENPTTTGKTGGNMDGDAALTAAMASGSPLTGNNFKTFTDYVTAAKDATTGIGLGGEIVDGVKEVMVTMKTKNYAVSEPAGSGSAAAAQVHEYEKDTLVKAEDQNKVNRNIANKRANAIKERDKQNSTDN